MSHLVLVVDDEHSIAETLREILAWEGYRVEVAPNGARALEAMRRSPPSLVLTDYMMPLLDGVQLLRAMRAAPELAGTPVILMSAAPLEGIPGVELAQALLQKPFEALALLQLIARLVAAPSAG